MLKYVPAEYQYVQVHHEGGRLKQLLTSTDLRVLVFGCVKDLPDEIALRSIMNRRALADSLGLVKKGPAVVMLFTFDQHSYTFNWLSNLLVTGTTY